MSHNSWQKIKEDIGRHGTKVGFVAAVPTIPALRCFGLKKEPCKYMDKPFE